MIAMLLRVIIFLALVSIIKKLLGNLFGPKTPIQNKTKVDKSNVVDAEFTHVNKD